MKAASYFVLEGPDGSGKSTQGKHLAEWLRLGQRREVLYLREPGSTPLGEALRALLLDHRSGDLAALTEALLFTAARAEMLRLQVAPALERGEIVLTDRCWLSTLVYQGLAPEDPAERISLDLLRSLQGEAHAGLWPARVFVLDVDPDTAAHRRSQGRPQGDRIESKGDEYLARVRAGFLELARTEPLCDLVDATRSFGAVQQDLRDRVLALLARGGP